MALRRPLEAHFEHFWSLLAKWLSGCLWKLILSISEVLLAKWLSGSLWRLILSISGACWPNGSQETSGDSLPGRE